MTFYVDDTPREQISHLGVQYTHNVRHHTKVNEVFVNICHNINHTEKHSASKLLQRERSVHTQHSLFSPMRRHCPNSSLQDHKFLAGVFVTHQRVNTLKFMTMRTVWVFLRFLFPFRMVCTSWRLFCNVFRALFTLCFADNRRPCVQRCQCPEPACVFVW